jgi:hypothetical protein
MTAQRPPCIERILDEIIVVGEFLTRIMLAPYFSWLEILSDNEEEGTK